MFIDSHAHLEMREFDQDRDRVVADATAAGVDYIITVGTNLEDCRKAIRIAGQYASVYTAIGIHPHDAGEIDDANEAYDELKAMAREKRVVAWGEIGLDFFRNHSPEAVQIRRFGEQLQMASDLDLPVIIHDREAHDQTVSMLKGWQGKRGGVIHCFSGDTAMAERCLEMGFYISIAGPVTYNKSEKLREVVRQIPLEHLLIETDAPYLAPQPHRGKRNEPAHVIHTAAEVAAIKGIAIEDVGRTTSENAKNLFGIP